MAAKAPSKPRRRPKRARRLSARERVAIRPRPSPVIPDQIADWRVARRVVDALARLQGPGPESASGFSRLVAELTAPYVVLRELYGIARRVNDGDRTVRARLRERIEQLIHAYPFLVDEGERLVAESAACGRRCHDAAQPQSESLLDLDALMSLIAVVHGLPDRDGGSLSKALLLLFGLTARTAGFEKLVETLGSEGDGGLARELVWLSLVHSDDSPPLRPLLVGDLPPLREFFEGFLDGIPLRWNPEIWDHPPIARVPYSPWRDAQLLICARAVAAAWNAQASEPPRPARVVWSDNITSVTADSPCTWSVLHVRGHDFGHPKPANVDLLVAINGKCRPYPVPAAQWFDDRIDVTLLPGVTSGPIGFVDADYVTAYDQWVDTVNAAWANVSASCGRRKARALLEHFHECPPETAVNWLSAGAAEIKSFTANGAEAVGFGPSEPITLSWSVINATSVRIDLMTAGGPLLNGQMTATGLSQSGTLTLPAINHTHLASFVYRLTAVGPCGTVTADITAVAAKKPFLYMFSVEVTQGLQTVPESIALVEEKPTVARLTVRHWLNGWGGGSLPNVKGRIRLVNGAQQSAWIDAANFTWPMAPKPGVSITVPDNPRRSEVNDSLNFLIPAFLCVGAPRIEWEVRVDGFCAKGPFPGYSLAISGMTDPRYFSPRKPLTMRYIRVDFAGIGAPTDDLCVRTLRSALPLLPTPWATISPLWLTPLQRGSDYGSDAIQDLVDEIDDMHNCDFFESMFEWLGANCPDDDHAIWVLIPGALPRPLEVYGRAAAIPSNTVYLVSGLPELTYMNTAHELGHCLNQHHLEANCYPYQVPGGAEPASSYPNGGQIFDIPFHPIHNIAVSTQFGQWDVMTYCYAAGKWTSHKRWSALWDEIGL
jgi:hypothetical protein